MDQGHAAAREWPRPSLTLFLLLILFFVFVSIVFSVSLLDDKIGWRWLAVMSFFGVVDLVIAYLVEMGIAILDVDPANPGLAGA